MKLTLCRAIMALIIFACIDAITMTMAWEMGVNDCQRNKAKCIDNTMCEEVKK